MESSGPLLTRRGLMAAGGAATAAALIGGPPAIARAGAGRPSHLRRSSYTALRGRRFRVSDGVLATGLTLDSVSDLAGSPAGSDTAFGLAFSGPRSAEPLQGTRRFSHPELGSFDLFITPAEAGDGKQVYRAIVNCPPDVPKRLPRTAPDAGGEAAAQEEERPLIRRASARRTARGVTVDLVLAPGADVQQVMAWLRRGKRVLAAGSRLDVHGRRVTLRLRTHRRLRTGPHEVVVMASGPDGRSAHRRIRLARR